MVRSDKWFVKWERTVTIPIVVVMEVEVARKTGEEMVKFMIFADDLMLWGK